MAALAVKGEASLQKESLFLPKARFITFALRSTALAVLLIGLMLFAAAATLILQ